MAADNTRKTSNVIHDLATLKTQVENNTNNIANATSPNDGKINLSVGTGLSLADGSANASANQAGNTSWTVNLDPENITLNQYLKNVDGVGPNATGGVDLKSTDSSLNITPDATNNSIDLTLNGTIPTVNDKTIGLVQGTGINISGANATTNMAANSSQCISLNANISDLNDVNTSGASLNQALVFNGTQWLPGTVSGSGDGTVKSVDGVGPNTTTGDIDLSSPSGSLTITPDTANHTVQLELNGTIPTVNDGKINMTASNGVKMSSDSQNASANQSGNTTFKIEADTDSLNSTLNFAKTTDIGNGSIGIIEGTGINVTGSNATANQSTNSNWTINLNANLSQLNDVSDTTASNNQVLTYDNGTWKPAASQTGGVTELSALNDTNVANPETGEILVYDKSTGKWNNQSPGENTAELPISSSDDTVKLSDDTTGGQTSNFIVETGTDVFKLVANANVFGTGTNPNGGPEVISIVGDGWGGIIVGDSVTGNRIPDGTVVVSKDESNDRVTLSQATTGDTLSTEELTFSHPAPESAQFQERMRINGIGQITAETLGYDDNVEAKSLVTKAWVEANSGGGVSNLPISSSDNKVTLSDDDNGQFQISTGADEASKTARVYVEADGKFGVGKVATTRFMVGDIDDSEFFYGSGFAYVRHESDKQSGLFLINNNAEGNAKRGIWGLALEDGRKNANSLYVYNSGVSGVDTDPRFEFTAGSTNNFIIKQGQLQTDTITTKDATSGDPADGKNNGDKVIRLKGNQVQITDQENDPGTGGYSLDIRDNRGMFRIRNDDVANGINDTATIALDVNSNANNTSIEFRTGNVKRAEIVKQSVQGNQYWAQYCTNGSASGIEFRSAWGQVTEKTFETGAHETVISTFEQNNDPDSDNYRGIENYVDRLTITKNDIKASDGYEPQTEDSLVTKGWVTTNAAVGNFLPLAGGTFDIASHVFMPSGNTVSPQLQVGCQQDLTGSTQGKNFALIVAGNKNAADGNKNAIFTVWSPNDTGIAYMKWAINEDATEYWNILANSISTNPGYEGNRFWQIQSGEGGAFITCTDSTDSTQRQVTINQTYLCTPRIGTVSRADGDAELRMMNSSMVAVAGDDLGNDPETGDPLGFSALQNKVLLGSYKYKANNSDEGKVRYASLSTRNGSFSAMPTTVSNQNTVAIDIYEQQNNADSCMSIQWNAAAGAFNAPSAEIKNVRQGSGANFHLMFSAMAAGELKEYLTLGDNQILASETYQPTEDNSLVTKSWVTTNGAKLPISSADGYTTLDALNVSEFSVRAKTTKLYNQTSDDVKLILHHNKSWVEGDGACYLYAGDTAGGRVGVGTGCTIAVGRTIDNPAYIPPDDPENPRPPEYDDTIPATIIESKESFRVCPEHGNVALGDTITGAATNGVFARWDSRSLKTNFVTYCDVATIPDVPKAVNPDYIADIDSRPDEYDPTTPEYILDPDATAEELEQYVSVMYGHWSQIQTLNSVGEAGGAPLTTVNFFAVPGAQDGLKTISKGFLHQSEARVTKQSYGFESQQTLVTGVTAYAFYASASAPSRFNGGLHTNTIRTQHDADGDVDIQLDGKIMRVNYTGGGNGGSPQYAPFMVAAETYKTGQENPDDNETGWVENYAICVETRNKNKTVAGGYTAQGLGCISTVPPNDNSSLPSMVFRASGNYGGQHIFASGGNSSNPADGEYQFLITQTGSLRANPSYDPDAQNALTTKKYVDSRIWKGTQSEYDALSSYDDQILYCITG